jgi:hypothetical protein
VFFRERDIEFPSLLIKTFKARYVRILDNAYNWRERDNSQFTYTLTRFERKLFELGHKVLLFSLDPLRTLFFEEKEREKGRC